MTTGESADETIVGVENADIGIVGIDHVGYAVPDLDAAIAFHCQAFGCTLIHREENPEQGVVEAMLRVGTDTIQLLAPLGPDSPITAFIDRHGPGVQQVAYQVSDVRHAADRLRERGLRVLYDQPRRGSSGTLINFVHPATTGGVLIELVEHPPR